MMTTKKGIENENSTNNDAFEHQDENPFTLPYLHDRLDRFVAKQQRQRQPCRLFIAVAGGGSHLISSLAATPGASSVLLQGNTLYDRESYHRFVALDDRLATKQRTGPSFRYTSAESSLYAAQAALEHALVLTASTQQTSNSDTVQQPQPHPMTRCIGLACTSALKTNTHTFSHENHGSRAYITACLPNGQTMQVTVTLHDGNNHNEMNNDDRVAILSPRSRWQEDVVVSHAMLTCLEYALQVQEDAYRFDDHRHNNSTIATAAAAVWTNRLLLPQRQQQEEESSPQLWSLSSDVEIMTAPSHSGYDDINQTGHSSFYSDQADTSQDCVVESNDSSDQNEATTALTWMETSTQSDQLHVRIPIPAEPLATNVAIRQAIESIQQGRESSVLLMPTRMTTAPVSTKTPVEETINEHSKASTKTTYFQRLAQTVLPPDSLVFPGSFNPPHLGHVQLVLAALKEQQQQRNNIRRENSALSSSSSSARTTTQPSMPVAWFELSVLNADKPPLNAAEAVHRLKHFLQLDIPFCWGVVLTCAPLFRQKVELLQPLQVSRNKSGIDAELAFCIGADTLVRLLDPKYYNNSVEQVLQTLEDMPCRFYVGGRLEQGKSKKTNENGTKDSTDAPFVTGHEQLEALPPRLRSKFTLLEGFRVDISSTDIRQESATTRGAPTV